jgi:predicted DNA-binding protein
MAISIRLDDDLEKELDLLSRQTGLSKGRIIKESLRQYLKTCSPPKTPYELGEDLFGRYSSGKDDLATRRKHHLNEKLHAKHAR